MYNFLPPSKIAILLTFLALSLLLPSCVKEEVPIIEIVVEEEIIIDIGDYALLDESLESIPYNEKNEIIFIDSLGNEALFIITEYDLIPSANASYIKYDVFEEGDTVQYNYTSQIKRFALVNDSLNLNFDLSLSSKPYYPDPESGYVADVLTIFCKNPENLFTSSQVFYQELDTRTWPTTWNTTPLPEIEFIGQLFYDVSSINYVETLSKVYFNEEFGMVSLTDLEGRLWRFKEFN